MLAQPELQANQVELEQLAHNHALQIAERLLGVTSTQKALDVTQEVATSYKYAVEDHIIGALHEIGKAVATHYADQVGVAMTEDELEEVVKHYIGIQLTTPYYGASLEDRFQANRRYLRIQVTRSAQVGLKLDTRKANLAKVLTESIPFGAHKTVDKRVLISEAQRLHNLLATHFANEADDALIRWRLSHSHSQQDICDEYATAVDKRVEAYMAQHGIDGSPRGMYFANELPEPPHPNCQCNFDIWGHKGARKQTIHREGGILRRLWKRIRGILA